MYAVACINLFYCFIILEIERVIKKGFYTDKISYYLINKEK